MVSNRNMIYPIMAIILKCTVVKLILPKIITMIAIKIIILMLIIIMIQLNTKEVILEIKDLLKPKIIKFLL